MVSHLARARTLGLFPDYQVFSAWGRSERSLS